MTPRRPQVPGLNEDWAEHQLALEPVCGSCTLVQHHGANGLSCDPERPGCPLHQVPEQTR